MTYSRSPLVSGGLFAAYITLPLVAKDLRLRSPLDFEQVRANGKSWTSDLVVAVVRPNELGHNRYGFAVGRRVGKAVARNRAKRLMRESARKLHPQLSQGHDVIFIARNRVGEATTQAAIDAAVEGVLTRAGLVSRADTTQ